MVQTLRPSQLQFHALGIREQDKIHLGILQNKEKFKKPDNSNLDSLKLAQNM